MQSAGGFESRKARWERRAWSNVPARADHAHPRRRAELGNFLANAAGADNADFLVADNYGIVSLVIEPVPPLVPVTQVKPTREMEKARQNILSHRAPVRKTARGSHDHVRAPQIGIEKIARPRGSFVDPFQARDAGSNIFHRRPAQEYDFS